MYILDDAKYRQTLDSENALEITATTTDQLQYQAEIVAFVSKMKIDAVIVVGMGGSALAGRYIASWLPLRVPFEVIRNYTLPQYVNEKTLVIVSSYSGNTEETISALHDAQAKKAQIVIVSTGGQLIDGAQSQGLPYIQTPKIGQPRMAVFYNLAAIVEILVRYFPELKEQQGELRATATWVQEHINPWKPSVPTEQNYAKQLAKEIIGKTAIIYAGPLMSPVAYKWKISINESAKHLAFWNEFPEFNHNEFIGWSGQPIEKPFAVFDIISNLEHPRILRRFSVTDRLLSGMRPHATEVSVQGKTVLEQLVWATILGDYVSIYLALLNGVNPSPVALVEKFKKEL